MQLRLDEQWDANYRKDPVLSRRFLTLNQSELKQLAASGACVGAHTLSHPMLSQSSPEAAWHEIAESKRRLDQALGQETWAFAYPFGDAASVTSREVEMAEGAGFKAAFLNVDAFASRISKFCSSARACHCGHDARGIRSPHFRFSSNLAGMGQIDKPERCRGVDGLRRRCRVFTSDEDHPIGRKTCA